MKPPVVAEKVAEKKVEPPPVAKVEAPATVKVDEPKEDLVAKIDLSSYRRIPWEDNVPFFLVSFFDADTGQAVSACSRSLLRTAVAKAEKAGYSAMAGGQLSTSINRPYLLLSLG